MSNLELEAVTKYVLHKHHLLEDSQGDDVLSVVNDIIALHATSVGTPYISLFARVKNFLKTQFDEQFYLRRNLIRLSAMRGTLFTTSTESAPILYQATKMTDSELSKRLQRWRISQQEYHKIAERLILLLKGGKTLPEIKKAMPRKTVRSVELKTGKTKVKMSNVNVILNALMSRGTVISEKAPGTLQITKANRYTLLKEVYPKLNLDSVEKEKARTTLVRQYIRAFGPVTQEDIAWWMGFNKAAIKETLAMMENDLLHIELNTLADEYLMLKHDFRQFLKFKPPENHSLILLPFEDPYTKGYRLRDRLVDKELESKVYVGGGVLPTILLNGKIVGIWNRNIEAGKGPIQIRFLLQHDKKVENKAIKQAKAVAALMTDAKIDVKLE